MLLHGIANTEISDEAPRRRNIEKAGNPVRLDDRDPSPHRSHGRALPARMYARRSPPSSATFPAWWRGRARSRIPSLRRRRPQDGSAPRANPQASTGYRLPDAPNRRFPAALPLQRSKLSTTAARLSGSVTRTKRHGWLLPTDGLRQARSRHWRKTASSTGSARKRAHVSTPGNQVAKRLAKARGRNSSRTDISSLRAYDRWTLLATNAEMHRERSDCAPAAAREVFKPEHARMAEKKAALRRGGLKSLGLETSGVPLPWHRRAPESWGAWISVTRPSTEPTRFGHRYHLLSRPTMGNNAAKS